MTTNQKELPMAAESNGTALAKVSQPTHPMEILQAAIQSGVPASELTQLMDLAERYDRNRAESAYNAAVARFQSLCPVVVKNRHTESRGNFAGYAFASYEDVMAVAKPHLDECGLSISFSFEPTERGLKTLCRISHGSHHEDHWLTIPIPADLKVNDTQKWGAACKYAQRYALCGALNIVIADEDTDANGLEVQLISESQADELNTLLKTTNSDGARFLKWAGVESIHDMSIAKYREAKRMLEAKPRA